MFSARETDERVACEVKFALKTGILVNKHWPPLSHHSQLSAPIGYCPKGPPEQWYCVTHDGDESANRGGKGSPPINASDVRKSLRKSWKGFMVTETGLITERRVYTKHKLPQVAVSITRRHQAIHFYHDRGVSTNAYQHYYSVRLARLLFRTPNTSTYWIIIKRSLLSPRQWNQIQSWGEANQSKIQEGGKSVYIASMPTSLVLFSSRSKPSAKRSVAKPEQTLKHNCLTWLSHSHDFHTLVWCMQRWCSIPVRISPLHNHSHLFIVHTLPQHFFGLFLARVCIRSAEISRGAPPYNRHPHQSFNVEMVSEDIIRYY